MDDSIQFSNNHDILSVLQDASLNPSKELLSYKNVVKDMEGILLYVKTKLRTWLKDDQSWSTLYVDYERPHLMRLFRNVVLPDGRKIRVMLHYFLFENDKTAIAAAQDADPSTSDDQSNLYHPHPWASIMKILSGSYQQDLGIAHKRGIDTPPPIVTSQTLTTGDVYQMSHPWLWHRVRPLETTSTLMITYIPDKWDQEKLPSRGDLRPLTLAETLFAFNHFNEILAPPRI
jgi:hypothetical protein